MTQFQLKLSRPLLAFLLIVVNAAATFLVPLIRTFAVITPEQAPFVEGFALMVLNGLAVYLATEEAQVPP